MVNGDSIIVLDTHRHIKDKLSNRTGAFLGFILYEAYRNADGEYLYRKLDNRWGWVYHESITWLEELPDAA